MAAGTIPNTTAAILRRLRALDASATKVEDKANGTVFACQASFTDVVKALDGLTVKRVGQARGVPQFLVERPTPTNAGGE